MDDLAGVPQAHCLIQVIFLTPCKILIDTLELFLELIGKIAVTQIDIFSASILYSDPAVSIELTRTLGACC